MQGRVSDENIKLAKQKAQVVCEYTLIGAFGRWATFPLEQIYYIASLKTNTKSYWQITKSVFQPAALYELQKIFFRTALTQTILKSISNMGVLGYIEHFHHNNSAWEQGRDAAFYVTPWETLFTSRGEYRKVHQFLKTQQATPSIISTPFLRVMSASFVRIYCASLITFCGIYETANLIHPYFSKKISDPAIKALAATSSSFLAQPIIMPFINFQTYVLRHPNQSLMQSIKLFYQEHTLKDLFRGTLGRSINRGAYYGLTFFISEYLKNNNQLSEQKMKPLK